MSRKYLLEAVLFPVLVLIGIMIKTELEIKQSKTIMVDIEGYDPRDLLRGHYLNFRFKWNFEPEKTKLYANHLKNIHPREAKLCVLSNGQVYPVATDEVLYDCETEIFGKFASTPDRYDFYVGLERFYLPETHAKFIEGEFLKQKGQMKLAVNSQGKAVLLELYIGGKPWRELIK